MIYCLNPHCPNPSNPDGGKFCLHCGKKLLFNDYYGGIKLIQKTEKGRTILGIDHSTTPESYCIIKQIILTESINSQQFLTEFEQNITQFKKLGDRREFPSILDSFVPPNLQDQTMPPTVIFEKIEGESLRQKLNTSGQFSEAEIRNFLIQVLPLVQAIHDQGLVHRDLSPDNLIFTPDQFWAIVDFTAAKVTSKVANIKQGTLIGSGIYTAPEQLRGKTYPASDLYSLGVICLELLTQMHPFDLYSAQADAWVWRDYLTTLISSELANLLDKMIAEKVGDRPPSAKAILETLGVKTQRIQAAINVPKIQTIEPQTKKQLLSKKIEPEWHCFRTFVGHNSYISDLSFDDQGQFLASASADQTIRIWDLKNRQEKFCLRGHKSIISRLILRGDRLISGGWDYTVRIWDWRNGEELVRLEGRQTWIQDLAWFEETLELITLGADQFLTLWNMEELTQVKKWHSHGADRIIVNPQNKVLVSANNTDICFWQDENITSRFVAHQGNITACKVSRNGKFLISIGADKILKIWSVLEQKCNKAFTLLNPIQALAIFPDHRFFCFGDDQGSLFIWQLGQEQPIATLLGHQGAIKAIAVSPDSQIIATGSADKTIKLWRFGVTNN